MSKNTHFTAGADGRFFRQDGRPWRRRRPRWERRGALPRRLRKKAAIWKRNGAPSPWFQPAPVDLEPQAAAEFRRELLRKLPAVRVIARVGLCVAFFQMRQSAKSRDRAEGGTRAGGGAARARYEALRALHVETPQGMRVRPGLTRDQYFAEMDRIDATYGRPS
jgi:hypothetical protein